MCPTIVIVVRGRTREMSQDFYVLHIVKSFFFNRFLLQFQINVAHQLEVKGSYLNLVVVL